MRFVRRDSWDVACNWKVYIDNFLENSKDFEGFDCYKRMFVKYVYKEKYINGFINEVLTYFRESPFYAEKFYSSYEMVNEIFQNLEKLYARVTQIRAAGPNTAEPQVHRELRDLGGPELSLKQAAFGQLADRGRKHHRG